jgi:hypothetical protein
MQEMQRKSLDTPYVIGDAKSKRNASAGSSEFLYLRYFITNSIQFLRKSNWSNSIWIRSDLTQSEIKWSIIKINQRSNKNQYIN